METQDPSVLEPFLHSDVFLWRREQPGRDVQHGRSMVATTLAALHARCTPTRISVYRVVEGTAVLSAFAGERAIWSVEVVFRGPLADAFSLSMPSSPAIDVAPRAP